MSDFAIALTFEGKFVRNWRVGAKGHKDAAVTVRESSNFPRVYCCLTCISNECDHVIAVREFDGASEKGAAAARGEAVA